MMPKFQTTIVAVSTVLFATLMTAISPTPASPNVIDYTVWGNSQWLAPGDDPIYSPDRSTKLVMQYDNNLDIYKDGKAIWSTKTNGKAKRGEAQALITAGGQVIVANKRTDAGLKELWYSGTAGSTDTTVRLYNSGSMLTYCGTRLVQYLHEEDPNYGQPTYNNGPNLFLNSTFNSWGSDVAVSCRTDRNTTAGCDGGTFFTNGWRGKVTQQGTAARFSQIDPIAGGVELDFSTTGADYVYFRQSISEIRQFSGKTLTVRVELEAASPGLHYDFYISARFNSENAYNVGRVPVLDAPKRELPTGSTIIYKTFQVRDDLNTLDLPLTSVNSLEAAFRIYTPQVISGSSAQVKSIQLYETGSPFDDGPRPGIDYL